MRRRERTSIGSPWSIWTGRSPSTSRCVTMIVEAFGSQDKDHLEAQVRCASGSGPSARRPSCLRHEPQPQPHLRRYHTRFQTMARFTHVLHLLTAPPVVPKLPTPPSRFTATLDVRAGHGGRDDAPDSAAPPTYGARLRLDDPHAACECGRAGRDEHLVGGRWAEVEWGERRDRSWCGGGRCGWEWRRWRGHGHGHGDTGAGGVERERDGLWEGQAVVF